MKIGAMVESFRLGLDGGLKAAAELGVDGVQIYATGGEMHPDNMNATARTGLLRKLEGLKLELVALCGDFGGHGFQVEEENVKRIADSKKVVDLAVDLHCKVVTTHIGVVPAKASHPRYRIMAKACKELGQYAAKRGVTFAIETGPEPAVVLKAFLDDIGLPTGMGVNFDPANLVMVCRENIPEAVKALAPYIVHTHAKDGVNVQPVDPEKLYGGAPGIRWEDYIREVPLGEGGVNFPTYLRALSKAGFDGYLTIEREGGADPAKNIREAVTFLRKLLKS
jgi:sugar phosphate isomerase/epimerase